MTDLFKLEVTEEEVFYLWNGERATVNQRPMSAWYEHVGHLGDCVGDELMEIRFRAAQKYFSKKDSSHANIYRHYLEVSKW